MSVPNTIPHDVNTQCQLQDEYGNKSAAGNEHGPACLEILGPAGTASQNVAVPDLRVAASQVQPQDIPICLPLCSHGRVRPKNPYSYGFGV